MWERIIVCGFYSLLKKSIQSGEERFTPKSSNKISFLRKEKKNHKFVLIKTLNNFDKVNVASQEEQGKLIGDDGCGDDDVVMMMW